MTGEHRDPAGSHGGECGEPGGDGGDLTAAFLADAHEGSLGATAVQRLWPAGEMPMGPMRACGTAPDTVPK